MLFRSIKTYDILSGRRINSRYLIYEGETDRWTLLRFYSSWPFGVVFQVEGWTDGFSLNIQ